MDRDSIERIRTATFPLARRGYERREVDRFLARLAEWLEADAPSAAPAPEALKQPPAEPSEAVLEALAEVGERTGGILVAAQEAAETLRSEAQEEADRLRSEADAYATEVRTSAEAEAERSRVDADTYSAETREGSEGYAAKTRRDADDYAAGLREEAEERAANLNRETDSLLAGSREKIAREESEQLELAQARAKALIDEATRRRDEIEDEIGRLEERRDAVIAGIERLTSELTGTATSHRPETGYGVEAPAGSSADQPEVDGPPATDEFEADAEQPVGEQDRVEPADEQDDADGDGPPADDQEAPTTVQAQVRDS